MTTFLQRQLTDLFENLHLVRVKTVTTLDEDEGLAAESKTDLRIGLEHLDLALSTLRWLRAEASKGTLELNSPEDPTTCLGMVPRTLREAH